MKKFVQEFESSKRELLDCKHLEYDPEWKKLFSWLHENITVDNYVSVQMQENVNNNAVKEELDSIEDDFPGIFEMRESDIKNVEAELVILREAEQEYQVHNEELRNIVKQINCDIKDLYKESADTFAQAEIWGAKFTTLETQLATLEAKKVDSARKLEEMYKNPEKILAVGSIPIDSLKMKMEIAWKRLCTCMTAFNTDGSIQDGQRLTGKIEHCADATLTQYERVLEMQTTVAGMQKLIEMIENYTDFPMLPAEICSQMAEMDRMAEIYEAQIDEITTECLLWRKHEITRQKEEIYTKIHEIKLNRAKNRIKRLVEIDEYAVKIIDIAELLWILLQIDSKRIRNFLSVHGMDQEPQIEAFLWKYGNPCITFKPSHPEVAEYILDPQRNDTILGKFSHLRNLEEQLKSLIMGPTNIPIFMSPDLSFKHFILSNLATKTDFTLKDIRDKFTKEYLNLKSSNKLWETRRMLWIWFLTQPQNVPKAIQVAASTPKISTKEFPGIRLH